MLIRNLDPLKGLCNGTRLRIEKVRPKVLTCRHFCSGELHLIPRIDLIAEETDSIPFRLRRRQFPIKTAFALTINKCQGQTFKKVAVWLNGDVFSHGQLYVACSRVTNRQDLKIFVYRKKSQPPSVCTTTNCVYTEVLKQ